MNFSVCNYDDVTQRDDINLAGDAIQNCVLADIIHIIKLKSIY